jgi:alanine dehydrogenase
MVIGVPKESRHDEHRVGLTPFLVNRLIAEGHTVLVERGAGGAAHFADGDYTTSGGQIVYTAEEVYKRSDLVCRVGGISGTDLPLLKPGLTICAFHHLAVASRERVAALMNLGTTLIGYEIIADAAGNLPVLQPMSDIAGQMAIHIAAHHLQTGAGGRGVLLGHAAGVPPPTVLVLGAGTVGHAAARLALAGGCHVIVLDSEFKKLAALDHELDGRAVTALAAPHRLDKYVRVADVVIGAILIPGGRAPFLVTEEMVTHMKAGSVIVDVSIDQGGCVETSRPTTLSDPVFTRHGVIHYAVPNMTANLARSASRALANALLPHALNLAGRGAAEALLHDPGLARGAYLVAGQMVNPLAGAALGVPAVPLESAARSRS